MSKRPPHRWFHALVVMGASTTACGGQTEEPGADAASDTAIGDVASDGGPAIPPIIIADAGGSPSDAKNDPRCCSITR
jgi:hypothetical protein